MTMGLFGKKKDEKKEEACCCGGNCDAERMAQADSVKAEGASVKVLGSG